tara:strand:- start:9 stop:539 length:531 start_codon:yes stop_codon:yes gene_type:complete
MSKKKDSDGDSAVFKKAMKGIKVQKKEKVDPYRKKISPRPIARVVDTEIPKHNFEINSEIPNLFEYRRPGIQHKVFQNLQKGVIQPEATLDMHGMHVNEAFSEFTKFFNLARKRKIKCVRIIHGKGHNSTDRYPVLKNNVFIWLQGIDSVLAFVSAPTWDGGSGATYVLLSKKEKK